MQQCDCTLRLLCTFSQGHNESAKVKLSLYACSSVFITDLTAIIPGEAGLADYIKEMNESSYGDKWSCKWFKYTVTHH